LIPTTLAASRLHEDNMRNGLIREQCRSRFLGLGREKGMPGDFMDFRE